MLCYFVFDGLFHLRFDVGIDVDGADDGVDGFFFAGGEGHAFPLADEAAGDA